MLVTMHHIVSDGWSMGVLVASWCACTRRFAAASRRRCRPLPVQYADYAVWQRQWLHGEALDRQLGYWRRAAAGGSVAGPARPIARGRRCRASAGRHGWFSSRRVSAAR